MSIHIKPYYGAGLILYSYDTEGRLCVMLEKRSKAVRQSGTWGIPGGGYSHRDGMIGEKRNLKRCAIREAFEETGIRVEEDKVWYVMTQKIPFYEYGVYAYHLDKPLTLKTADFESDEIAWFPIDSLPEGCNPITKYELEAFSKALSKKEKQDE